MDACDATMRAVLAGSVQRIRMEICRWGLDLLGVAWRMNRADSLSVARRDAVATLDRHVGPKS